MSTGSHFLPSDSITCLHQSFHQLDTHTQTHTLSQLLENQMFQGCLLSKVVGSVEKFTTHSINQRWSFTMTGTFTAPLCSFLCFVTDSLLNPPPSRPRQEEEFWPPPCRTQRPGEGEGGSEGERQGGRDGREGRLQPKHQRTGESE